MAHTARFASLLLVALLLPACGDKDDAAPGNLSAPVDADGDGYPEEHDCDDNDPTRNPGAQEVCDGVDQDCDDLIDENAADLLTLYADTDGDGYGDPDNEVLRCSATVGAVADATDCDDGDAARNPGATETCDEIDNDCDGQVDAEDPDIDPAELTEVWPDADGDDHGDANASSQLVCYDRDGWSLDKLDCDDGDPRTFIGAARVEAPEACMQDLDNDGWGSNAPTSAAAIAGTDCDDGRALVNPEAWEYCDELDNDCNGAVDDSCEGEVEVEPE
jgi:hypothetical protein